MAGPSDAVLARGWWEYHRWSIDRRAQSETSETSPHEEAEASHDLVDRAVRQGGVEAIDLVAAIIEATPAGTTSRAVADGPLRDLLQRHGDDLIATVESYARQRPAFRRALSLVWIQPGRLDTDTEHRLALWIAGFTTNP